MPPTADMENKIDSGCHLQKNVIVKQYILDHAVRSPSLTFKKRMALFFCRVQCHRELLKKTNINFCILSYWVQSKWQTLFLPFLSLPFNLLSIKPKVTLSSTLCVCGERGGVSITSNFINCKKKKKTNYYIYCSLSEFYIKYMFIPNSIHHLTDQIPKPILLLTKIHIKTNFTVWIRRLF